MIIRQAKTSDAAAIAAIAESVRFDPRRAEPNAGYLVYVGSPEEYAERLEHSETSYVVEKDGKTIAFLLTTAAPGLTATHADTDAVLARLFGEGTMLVDQIGVLPSARGLGAAPEMFAQFLREAKPRRLTASIMHGPMRNARSLGFFTGRFGFRCIGEYAEGDGMFWGIYEWKADGTAGEAAYPLGRFLYSGVLTAADLEARLGRLAAFPAEFRATVGACQPGQLDQAIRPGAWTARQVIHHVADAAAVLSERVRLILTEERPAIKTFEEEEWVKLEDEMTAPPEESLAIVEGTLGRLVRLLRARPREDYAREMRHPQQGLVPLDRVTAYLDWHGRHHCAQIAAMRG